MGALPFGIDAAEGIPFISSAIQLALDSQERDRRFQEAETAVSIGEASQTAFAENILPGAESNIGLVDEEIDLGRSQLDETQLSVDEQLAGLDRQEARIETNLQTNLSEIRSNVGAGLAALGFDETINLADPRDDPGFADLKPEAQAAAIQEFNQRRNSALSTNRIVQETIADIQKNVLDPLQEERSSALSGVAGAAVAGQRALKDSIAEMRRNGLPESFIQGEIQRSKEQMAINVSTGVTQAHSTMAERITVAGTQATQLLATLKDSLASGAADLFRGASTDTTTALSTATTAGSQLAQARVQGAQVQTMLGEARANFETAARADMLAVRETFSMALQTHIALGTMAQMNGVNIRLGVPPIDVNGTFQPAWDNYQTEQSRHEASAQASANRRTSTINAGIGAVTDVGSAFIPTPGGGSGT